MTKDNPPRYRRPSPTPETRAKLSKALKGRPKSVEHRAKMSAARAAYYAGEEGEKRRKMVGKRNRAYQRRLKMEAAK